jgi:Flp pilus assembly protein TadB
VKKTKKNKLDKQINTLNSKPIETIKDIKSIKDTKYTEQTQQPSKIQSTTAQDSVIKPKPNFLSFFKIKRKEVKEISEKEKFAAEVRGTKKKMGLSTRFDKKKRTDKYRIEQRLSEFLEKAGVEEKPREFNKKIIYFDILLVAIVSLIIIVAGITLSTPFLRLFVMLLLIWTLVLIALYLVSIVAVFSYLDVKIYQRTKQLEEVLPDFLQLTSANISAGMPIDRALWLAVRPRFGVLAKEIEEIAKATIAGEDLDSALLKFSKKYDSRILKESINLLIAGINAGGEIAELLNKISINLQETKLMQKEIAANVMTYVIFIGVATIAAAPFLFALSGQLLDTTKTITSNVDLDSSGGSGSSFSFNFSGDGIKLQNFQNFAILMMILSSIFSVAIISTIRKGNVKEGLKLIPVFLGVSFFIYFASKAIFASVLGGLF